MTGQRILLGKLGSKLRFRSFGRGHANLGEWSKKLGKREIRSHRRTQRQGNAKQPFITETSWAKTQEHNASPNLPTVQCDTVLLRIHTVRVQHSVMGSVSFPERYLLRFGVPRYNEMVVFMFLYRGSLRIYGISIFRQRSRDGNPMWGLLEG